MLLFITILLILGFSTTAFQNPLKQTFSIQTSKQRVFSQINTIGEIPLPQGFSRLSADNNSFGAWLRTIKLKKDNTVYLYNWQPIARQDLHYAVLDISTGNKDLQQCADCIMRLKAEYYYSSNDLNKITFTAGNKQYSFTNWLAHNSNNNIDKADKHALLLQFMQTVFINCGTYTVEEMSKPVNIHTIQPGDIFVKAGAPGHAMIVADVATNGEGKTIYILAQGYMPAQNMHIVINPQNTSLSPWYEVNNDEQIITPGWIFQNTQLRR